MSSSQITYFDYICNNIIICKIKTNCVTYLKLWSTVDLIYPIESKIHTDQQLHGAIAAITVGTLVWRCVTYIRYWKQ